MYRHSAKTFTVAAFLLSAGATHASCILGYGVADPAQTVTDLVGGGFSYQYAVQGAKQVSCIVPTSVMEFSLPYFTDAGITSIVAPAGWSYAIDPTDFFKLGAGAETLTWTAVAGHGIAPSVIVSSVWDPVTQTIVYQYSPSVVLAGFGYKAQFAPVKGPYNVVLNGFNFTGDPAIPGSPAAMAAGLTTALPFVSSVPEPGTTALLAVGLLALSLIRRTRRAPAH